ncbi:zinc ribbon domain-containing protein [Anthocerotibacter panamensis]|uniref:zinc ribbon domain-containing protein n=1 Tax=Anthocerotibacter panamensis TaxID=2857077 RepID=UPI001C4077F6|nr:zinc ribbon domain-containing protein [Anthocerotibacter panamensis]
MTIEHDYCCTLPHCNNPVEKTTNFCVHCGHSIRIGDFQAIGRGPVAITRVGQVFFAVRVQPPEEETYLMLCFPRFFAGFTESGAVLIHPSEYKFVIEHDRSDTQLSYLIVSQKHYQVNSATAYANLSHEVAEKLRNISRQQSPTQELVSPSRPGRVLPTTTATKPPQITAVAKWRAKPLLLVGSVALLSLGLLGITLANKPVTEAASAVPFSEPSLAASGIQPNVPTTPTPVPGIIAQPPTVLLAPRRAPIPTQKLAAATQVSVPKPQQRPIVHRTEDVVVQHPIAPPSRALPVVEESALQPTEYLIAQKADPHPVIVAAEPAPILPVRSSAEPGTELRPGVAFLANVNGFNANTDDLKRAIGDLPLLENQQKFPDYAKLSGLISAMPPKLKAQARQVIAETLAGKFQGIPNDVRIVLIRYLKFKTYGKIKV